MPQERSRQKHSSSQDTSQSKLKLIRQEEEVSIKINKLVSLTYDENPEVRKNAAKQLSEIDDPRSVFALLELTSDKDEGVRELANKGLEKFKEQNFKEEKEAIVNLGKLFEAKQEGTLPIKDAKAAKSKLMPSIEKLFSHMEPKKAERLKRQLLPSIEKLFFRLPARINEQEDSGLQKQDATSNLETIEIDANSKEDVTSTPKPSKHLSPKQQGEEAANFPLPENMREKGLSALSEIEAISSDFGQEEEKDGVVHLPPSRIDFYKWAYALAVTPGMTAKKMKAEEKRLITQLKKDVSLAFRLAVSRAKENGIESLTGLKPGMKRIATFPLEVVGISHSGIKKGKKEAKAAKILITDGKKTMPLYVDPARAEGIAVGDHISLQSAYVDFLVEKNEMVFLLGKKGKIILTK